MQPERFGDLEVLLGHSFRDRRLLDNALSHSSIKTDDRPSNERLEFLGDSVLGLILSDALYRRFPNEDEGTLTRIKSHAVSRATLQRVAVAMGLDRYILVGKGVAKREIPASLLGNLFEAIVGAIYLDAGLAATRKFVLRHLNVVVEEIVEDRAERNYKSLFQHYCQRELGGVPSYRVLRESGPAHSRAFEVAIHVNGREYGRARAASKKEAEQGAARAAMIHFRQIRERPEAPARGAGTIIRVGPEGNGKSKKKRRKRGRKPAAEMPAPEPAKREEEAAAPAKKKRGSRRRGGRGRKRAAPEAKPEPAAETKAPRKKTAKKTPAKKSAKKTSRRRRSRSASSKEKGSGGAETA